MPLAFENIVLEVQDGVAWITLNRPEQLNAFADEMREELLQAILAVQEDDAAHVLVITGAGRAFCAGGDVRTMAALKEDNAGFERLRPLLDAGRRVITVLHQLPKPAIAMVNGVAAGAGCNLALACDLRVASDQASFAESFISIGMHPDWGGTFFLPRLVGTGRALEMMWTGERIHAEMAEEIGLVHQVVPAAHLREHTERLALRLARAPRTAVRLIKLAVYNSLHYDLESMLDYESEAQSQCWSSTDSAEGIAAFLEKRPPQFHQGEAGRMES
jgi:2-(1,2-epoxy-1,2-dihydrophenyl)acetyl-CoA isomerase